MIEPHCFITKLVGIIERYSNLLYVKTLYHKMQILVILKLIDTLQAIPIITQKLCISKCVFAYF